MQKSGFTEEFQLFEKDYGAAGVRAKCQRWFHFLWPVGEPYGGSIGENVVNI